MNVRGRPRKQAPFFLAEAERFELSIPFGIPVFETGGINHYPTPPAGALYPNFAHVFRVTEANCLRISYNFISAT